MSDNIRPFHCGSQAADWSSRNCDCCKRGFWWKSGRGEHDVPISEMCELDVALAHAQNGDGTVSPDVAKRIGYRPGNAHYNWPCGEIEPASDDIARAVAAWRAKYTGGQASGGAA